MKNYVRVLRKKKSHKDFFGWNPTLAKRVDKLEEAWLDPDTGEVFLEIPADPPEPEEAKEPATPPAPPKPARESSKPRKPRASRKKPTYKQAKAPGPDWP